MIEEKNVNNESQEEKNSRYWGFLLLAGVIGILAIGAYALAGAFGEMVFGAGLFIEIVRRATGGA